MSIRSEIPRFYLSAIRGVRYPGSTQPARRSLASYGENAALAALNAEFAELYAADGRPSIAPERLLRAALIQILFSIRTPADAAMIERRADRPVR